METWGEKFSVKGVTWGPTSLKVKDNDRDIVLYPRYDYIKWSSNVKIFQKVPGKRKKQILYIEQHLEFLNLYEVIDVETKKSIGTIRYHFGNWEIVDTHDNYFIINKDSPFSEALDLGAGPRFFGEIQKTSEGVTPIFFSYEIDFSFDKEKKLNRSLGLAVFILFVLKSESIFSMEQTKRLLSMNAKKIFKSKKKVPHA